MNKIKFPEFKDYTDQTVHYLQSKLDGHLCKVFTNDSGNIQAFSKNDKDITTKLLRIKHIAQELARLPNNSAIFGEMWSIGIFASSIPTLLNAADEKLQLTIFAAPLINRRDMSERDLLSVMDILQVFGIKTSKTSFIPEGRLSEKQKEELLQKARDTKSEGWVIKEGHMKGWYKLKPVKTIDAFITDVQVSDSKTYKGCFRSVSLGLWNVEHYDSKSIHALGICGGGFTKKFKLSLDTDEKRQTLIGKVMEVDFDSITAGKKLRFPRFIRWRDDKDSKDCTVEQLGD